MNTIKERLENKTNKVLVALDALAALSKYGDKITAEDIEKIRVAIDDRFLKTMIAISIGRDAVQFSLEDDKS